MVEALPGAVRNTFFFFFKSLSTQENLPTQEIDYTVFFTEAVSKLN